VRPPYFPVTLDSFPGQFRFHDVTDETIEIGSAKVIVKPVPHLGPTVGYRIEWDEAVIAYVSDHQEPEANPQEVNDDVLALCHEADLVIHDAQFTRAEFLERSHWGHSTIDYAVRVAAKAGAKRLALFHHDPSHTDDDIDEMSSAARVAGASAGLSEVFAAREGLRIRLGE
jgi:ribonuclease BN (tRNA processing enzyme)